MQTTIGQGNTLVSPLHMCMIACLLYTSDRFGVVNHMEFYTVDELKHIIVNSVKVLGVEIDDKGAYEMARRSRGTPRPVSYTHLDVYKRQGLICP